MLQFHINHPNRAQKSEKNFLKRFNMQSTRYSYELVQNEIKNHEEDLKNEYLGCNDRGGFDN